MTLLEPANADFNILLLYAFFSPESDCLREVAHESDSSSDETMGRLVVDCNMRQVVDADEMLTHTQIAVTLMGKHHDSPRCRNIK